MFSHIYKPNKYETPLLVRSIFCRLNTKDSWHAVHFFFSSNGLDDDLSVRIGIRSHRKLWRRIMKIMRASSLTWPYKLERLAWTVFCVELAANAMISVVEWRSSTSTDCVSSTFCNWAPVPTSMTSDLSAFNIKSFSRIHLFTACFLENDLMFYQKFLLPMVSNYYTCTHN